MVGPALIRAWHSPLLTRAHQYILLCYQSKTKIIIKKKNTVKRCRKLHGESNCPSPPFCIHSAFSYMFFCRWFHTLYSAFAGLQACRHGWVGAFSSAPGFCCFPACLGDLSISLLADLPHSFERLPRTACKSSTGDSNA